MLRKSILMIIIFSFVFAGCGDDMTNTPSGQGPSGQETTSCNISISSYEEFDKIRENLSCNYTLTADIDFPSNTDFEPIGIWRRPFTGVLDGAGHTIKNVTIKRETSSYVGVIGFAKDGTIKGLTFEKVAITGKSYVGVIGASSGTIMNVYVKGDTITGTGEVGGLVGSNFGTIENSYATGSVSATGDSAGGLVGSNSGLITKSYATGNVSAEKLNAGGLVGINSTGPSKIENSYATGTVSGTYVVGGLIGENYGYVTNSYAIGSVIGSGSSGGLSGRNPRTDETTITNSYYDKTSTKQTDTGKGTGLAGAPTSQDQLSGFDFANVWVFTAGQWPKLAWQTN